MSWSPDLLSGDLDSGLSPQLWAPPLQKERRLWVFCVTYKMDMAREVTAVRDLARKCAEHGGRQRGGAEAGRTQQVQGWHRAAGCQF